jgi:hypothetical protein
VTRSWWVARLAFETCFVTRPTRALSVVLALVFESPGEASKGLVERQLKMAGMLAVWY